MDVNPSPDPPEVFAQVNKADVAVLPAAMAANIRGYQAFHPCIAHLEDPHAAGDLRLAFCWEGEAMLEIDMTAPRIDRLISRRSTGGIV